MMPINKGPLSMHGLVQRLRVKALDSYAIVRAGAGYE